MNENVLNNKNCFLTGATGGLGRQLVFQLIKKGCNLFLTAKSEYILKKLKNELEKINVNCVKIDYYAADVTNIVEVNRLIKKIRNNFGTIDVLINCAGIFPINALKDSDVKDFDKCFNVNVKAPFLFSREFAKDMIKKKWGRIINIGSSSSYSGFKNTSMYSASKHAVLGLSRSLHVELKEHNIRTFCVSPASIKTKMAQVLTEQDFSTFMDPKQVAEFIVFVILFDKEMVADEIRLNRMKLQ